MNDRFVLLRALCFEVAETEHESRKIKGLSVVMGVHLLVYQVRRYQFAHSMKVDDPDTVRRRFNELATEEYGHKMSHVGEEQEKFYDLKPNEFQNERTHVVELQSAYVLDRPEEMSFIDAAIARAKSEKRYGYIKQGAQASL